MKNQNRTNAMIRALENTGVRMFMYYPENRMITVPRKTCELYQCASRYENMPESFAQDFVLEEDHEVFKDMYDRIDRGEETAQSIFHSKDRNKCCHVTLTTISWSERKTPIEVIGLIEDMSDLYQNEKILRTLQEELEEHSLDMELDEAVKTMAEAIGSQYYGVYYIWLDSQTFVCLQEHLGGLLPVIGKKGLYEPAFEKFITGFIEEADQDEQRAFMDIHTLKERIGLKNTISQDYRRKGIGWSRGQFIVGRRDENGLPGTLIYTVADIHEEVESRLRQKEAEEEALHDPMTRLWNRKAFERFRTDRDYVKNPTGLLMFDIDRFKGINDQYGHDEGDRVIISVAQAFRGILRQKDLVFRMGGDEFVVLLYDCNETVFSTVCRKIETIHADIKRILPKVMNVSVSAGLCVSQSGYHDEMYNLADQAMYNTKVNGRGGCSLIDEKGKILKEWHDQSGYLRKGEVLEKNSTVTWRLDKPRKEGLPYRVYGDELFCAFVGLKSTATPEQLYQAWRDRVEPDYIDVIKEAARLAIQDGKVEVVFDWNHPEKGVIQLRCSGSLESMNEDYYTFIGYVHVLTGTHVVTIEDIDAKIKNAMEEMYFCNYYVRLRDYSFKAHKIQPYMKETIERYESAVDAIHDYVNNMISEEYKERMSVFLDLTTIKTRMKNINAIGMDYSDPYIGWARAKFVVVDRDAEGEAETICFIVEPIQQAVL